MRKRVPTMKAEDHRLVAPFLLDGRWGFEDKDSGQTVIPPIFELVVQDEDTRLYMCSVGDGPTDPVIYVDKFGTTYVLTCDALDFDIQEFIKEKLG